MPIEFTVRTADLRRAVRQLEMGRGEFHHSDIADMIVSPSTLEIKAVGTASCMAASGKQPGSVRLPLRILVNLVAIVKTYHQQENAIWIENGFAKVGRSKLSHRDISVGEIRSHPLSIPPDASSMDTLAAASMMTPDQTADAGLRERVEIAKKKASSAIEVAMGALKEFNFTSDDLTKILAQRVLEHAEVIRASLKD